MTAFLSGMAGGGLVYLICSFIYRPRKTEIFLSEIPALTPDPREMDLRTGNVTEDGTPLADIYYRKPKE